MTWDIMTHEVKKLKHILKNKNEEIVGFTVSGMTYDGDGNPQDENGTDMDIQFNSTLQMRKTLVEILRNMGDENGKDVVITTIKKLRTEKEIQDKINKIEKYKEHEKSKENIKMTLAEIYGQQIHMLKWALGEEK